MMHWECNGDGYGRSRRSVALLLLLSILFSPACQHPAAPKDKPVEKHPPSFQQQLDVFKQLGFVLNPGVDTSDINRWDSGYREFEKHPYKAMYITLGQTLEREPFTPLTNKIWEFDPEAVEQDGDYTEIMNNISRISGGELIFDGLNDHLDIEKKIAWISFDCHGDAYRWNLEVRTNWIDGSLFDRIRELTEKYHTKRKFTFFNTGGQDFVLGYATPEELEAIRNATGLNILWLKGKEQLY